MYIAESIQVMEVEVDDIQVLHVHQLFLQRMNLLPPKFILTSQSYLCFDMTPHFSINNSTSHLLH